MNYKNLLLQKFALFNKRYQMARIKSGIGHFKFNQIEGLGFQQNVRKYKSYNSYVRHQALKARFLGGWKEVRVRHFRTEFASSKYLGKLSTHETVLCVGARFGEEVFVLREMGYLAHGIDLNPGNNNKFVSYGDVHELAFPTGVLDKVFCNVLDHILMLEKAMTEMVRVLKPSGILIFHIQRQLSGEFEVREWASVEEFAIQIGNFIGVQAVITERASHIEAVYSLTN